MSLLSLALGIGLLTASYWMIDQLVRQDRLGPMLAAVPGLGARAPGTLRMVPLLALAPLWSWSTLPEGEAVRLTAGVLCALLAWKATTKDIDIVTGEAWLLDRLVLVAAAVIVWISPAGVLAVAWGASRPFALWEHHSTLPMRALQAIGAWLVLGVGVAAAQASLDLGAAGPTLDMARGSGTLWWFLVTMQVSHYLITALAKGWLGPKWYRWVTDNRLHHLAASAYSWGWARFVPWSTWWRVVRGVARVERPMQAAAFGVELLAPLALLAPEVAIGLAIVWSAFHLGVFALSGLLFWDWVGANLAIAVGLAASTDAALLGAFGPAPLGLAVVFLVLWPLRHKLWRPMPLGWWDTPLTQRMHWRAEGRSGQVYALTNAFLCPHERLFGKVYGCFLVPRPVFTYHLGEVWKHDLRDAIRAAGPDPVRLDAVRARYGILPRDPALSRAHVQYLTRFFQQLARGARKHVLPRGLRWLKAPGGQVFYWSDLPRYRGQEPIERVHVSYREEYFDGVELRRLCDTRVLTVEVGEGVPDAPPVRLPTPKMLDELLLGYAAGKLIDLPDFGGGFVAGDDGDTARHRPREAPVTGRESLDNVG